MTPTDAAPDAALQAAIADLEELRQVLLRASRGTAETTEVKIALQDYWRDHRDALRSTARALADQMRAQTLEALYAWRDQLGEQLDAKRGSKA